MARSDLASVIANVRGLAPVSRADQSDGAITAVGLAKRKTAVALVLMLALLGSF
jgi:hypothetical protein